MRSFLFPSTLFIISAVCLGIGSQFIRINGEHSPSFCLKNKKVIKQLLVLELAIMLRSEEKSADIRIIIALVVVVTLL